MYRDLRMTNVMGKVLCAVGPGHMSGELRGTNRQIAALMRPDVFADKTLEACSADGGDERQEASCQRSARPRSFALTAWRQARHQQPSHLHQATARGFAPRGGTRVPRQS